MSELLLGVIGGVYEAWAGLQEVRFVPVVEQPAAPGLHKYLIEIEQATPSVPT